ncbi:RING-H2 finger protein ATL52-like protein [Cinnamomum micranthum f. kanehirae]|uniref:RING-type E3 ubiquitin transferase n=1 Tax=Cinnamomum micranthum f. kanehirae TaxID=337451 RepID=A0A443PXD3_9MAGN|nr:RING-H2 finger protein ATL52-like protein [Cinnamomum micranthum f. kanehirae]
MVMGGFNGGISVSTFGFAIIGILSAAIMLLIYHCILVRWSNRGNPLSLPSHQLFPPHGEGTPSGIDNSFIQLIPAYKYGKVAGESGEGENICSVCLCEFKEGEDVRQLPDCLHSFHAPCIDMWLYSHSNCPLCRAEMTPSPLLPLRRSPPPDAGEFPHIGGG